jgi:hypothetical protein
LVEGLAFPVEREADREQRVVAGAGRVREPGVVAAPVVCGMLELEQVSAAVAALDRAGALDRVAVAPTAVRVLEAALDKERLGVELAAREGRRARCRD